MINIVYNPNDIIASESAKAMQHYCLKVYGISAVLHPSNYRHPDPVWIVTTYKSIERNLRIVAKHTYIGIQKMVTIKV